MWGRSTARADEHVERLVGTLLRVGVTGASVVVVLGGILYLARYGALPADHHSFHGEPADLRSPWGIARAAAALHARGLIQLGVLILIATPVVRAALLVWGFARQRDWVYVVISITVLCVLLFGLVSGHATGVR